MTLKIPFRKQQFDAREEAILDAVNGLLSDKGYDLMTMEDVAAAVGVAKGSLYKHFSSKEKLAAAVLSRLLRETLAVLDAMPADWPAVRKLEEILRWSLQHRLRGGVPHLPSTSRALQRSLILNLEYVALALRVNKRFHTLVAAARRAGDIAAAVPDDVIVYTLYSRACDPTVEFLVRDGKLTHEEIVEAMVAATFDGFRSHAGA
ncbi:MAG: TetR/AcrR family transcriptional regulator [Betaproteobacteria bacterium]|nr:MAG: TetR/AcrR family transcriptional regulator [Betaproteobacteria bacterium]